jgi:hypothetical protein
MSSERTDCRLGTSADLRIGIGYALAWKPLYGVWF